MLHAPPTDSKTEQKRAKNKDEVSGLERHGSACLFDPSILHFHSLLYLCLIRRNGENEEKDEENSG